MRAYVTICILTATLAAMGVTLTPVGEFPLPGLQSRQEGPPGLSGITRVGGDTYFVVCDKGGLLHQMTIRIDRDTGVITGCRMCRVG